jgi:transposase-like protein
MAARIKIEDVVGQPIAGSPLVITGPAGVDSHGSRLVTVDCSRCGSSGTVHRLSRVINAEITSCSCAERDAHAAYRQRGVDSLSTAQRIAVYESVESGIPVAKIATKYGRDRYTINACWQQEQARVDALSDSVQSAIVWLGLSGSSYAVIARRFGIGIHAVAKVISAWKRRQGAANPWHASMEYLLESKILSAVCAAAEAKSRTFRRGEYLSDQFMTGSRAKQSAYGPAYETLLEYDPAVFTPYFRAKAIEFLKACRFTQDCRAERKRKHASVQVPVSTMPEPSDPSELAAA